MAREIAALTFLTLDGVMQSPSSPEEDPIMDFRAGGWAAPYWDQVMAQVYDEAMSEPYDLLLGHNTYKMFASHWPNVSSDDPVAERLNSGHKFVASIHKDRVDLPWQPATLLNGDTASAVRRLKRTDGPLLQVHGSWQLLQTLVKAHLVDEYRLWRFPVLTGQGKRLFQDSVTPDNLRLVRSSSTNNGVTMAIYRRAD